MKTMLALCLIFSVTQVSAVFANESWYPESTLEKFRNQKISEHDLREEIFNLSEKIHVTHPGSSDTLSDRCPNNADCTSQRRDLTYNEARKLMFGNLFLEIIGTKQYSLKEVYCNITLDESHGVGPNLIPNPKFVNCEHTWPQSKFSKSFPSELQKSDLHHLFPSDMRANSTRNNHPFAEVNGKVTHEKCQDSQIGNAIGSSVRSFEPPREHKGNVARAIYYFSTRYKMSIDPTEAKYLKQWNIEDPVDDEEMARNEKIMDLQGNRNPFVDYPELIDRF